MKNRKELSKRLKTVLSTQATSYEYDETVNYLIDEAYRLGGEVEIDDYDNVYITKGIAEVYPCVVAHTDTVHDIYKGYKVYDVNGNFVAFDSHQMRQVGTGGDDKVGIWVCLEMLEHFDNIKICFFAQEEIGCVGSSRANADFFLDVGYVFQCDRKGNSDFVQTSSGVEMFGERFTALIKPTLTDYGYGITDGGLTDVNEISQIANVCCANMSCGYYEPHSSREFVNISDAINTMEMVRELITNLGEVKHEYEAKSTYNHWGYSSYGNAGAYKTKYATGTVVKQESNFFPSKPDKKAKVVVNNFDSCELCGEISTNGCDYCIQEEPLELNSGSPCSCGDVLRSYGSGVNRYAHCFSCGYYEDCDSSGQEIDYRENKI